MPSKKQRRRRLKERRHEYEYVYVDDDGREVEPPPDAEPLAATKVLAERSRRSTGRTTSRGGRREPRATPPPSWTKAALFSAAGGVFILFISGRGKHPPAAGTRVALSFFYALVILVFMYGMQSMVYRAYRKRIGDPLPPRRGRAPKQGREQKS